MNNYVKKIILKDNYIYKIDSNILNDYIKFVENKLEKLNLYNIPKIKFFCDKTYYYEYIDGIELYNLKKYNYNLIKNEYINLIKSIEILLKNNITTLEIKPKNIIVKNSKLYLIDIIDVVDIDVKTKIYSIKKEIIRTFVKIKLNKLKTKNLEIDNYIIYNISNKFINQNINKFYLGIIDLNFNEIINWISNN